MTYISFTTTICKIRIKQKAMESAEAAEMEYSEKLNRMSRYR